MNSLAEGFPPASRTPGTDQNRTGPCSVLRALILEAVGTGARTIHVEPTEDGWQVRLRRACGLSCKRISRSSMLGPRLSRLTNRGPRFELVVNKTTVRMTIHEIPTTHGASWLIKAGGVPRVVPLLDEQVKHHVTRKRIRQVLEEPAGLVFLSGRDADSTALLRTAIAQDCVAPDRRVLRLEDNPDGLPSGIIECLLTPELRDNVSQIAQLDADVIVVGDLDVAPDELATLARRASRSALVVIDCSSHDIEQALTCIAELDLNKDWVYSRTRAVIRHDEVALLCTHCRQTIEQPPSLATADASTWLDTMLHPGSEANGCEHCHDTGIGGVEDVVDVLAFNDRLRDGLRANDRSGLLYELENRRLVPGLLEHWVRNGYVAQSESERIAGQARVAARQR